MECIEKIIKKDMTDPTNGKKMTDKDIIPLERVCNQNIISCYYNCTASYVSIVLLCLCKRVLN